MYCKKRIEPDGQHLPSSLMFTRPVYMKPPEAQLRSSLDSEPTCFVQQNFATPYADAGYISTADRKYALVTVGKRSCSRTWRTGHAEECVKRSRVEFSDATVSGVTFQKDLTLHHSRKPDAESELSSVRRHVSLCDDAVCLKPKRLIRCNETDVDKDGICTKTDEDEHVTFICSRVQESRGNVLSVARQCTRGIAVSSISCCGQSRDGSHSHSTNSFCLSRFSDSSKTPRVHLEKAKAGDRRVSSKHVVTSLQINSKESQRAPVLNLDTMHTRDSPPSYVLSSGRLSLEQEARLGRRIPTIDDDFEEYFSSLML